MQTNWGKMRVYLDSRGPQIQKLKRAKWSNGAKKKKKGGKGTWEK